MADPAPTPTTADPAAPTADPAPPTTQADPVSGSDKQPPWGDPENFNAEKAWELIQSLRASDRPGKVSELEGKVSEMEAAQKAQMDALATALGLKPSDTPPDPAKLAEQVTAEQGKTTAAEARATAAERQLAVFKAAPEVEGNALALLDSASFLTSIAEIDPTDTAKLNEAITAAVEKNPLFKASATPPMPPLNGGPRSSAPTGAGSLGEAVANKMAATQNR